MINSISAFLLDIFFPKRCIGCGRYGSYLCLDCAGQIEKIKTDLCPTCGKISEKGKFCPQCRYSNGNKLTGIIVAAKYDAGPTKELIHHLKYSGYTEISDDLGELLAEKILNLNIYDCVVVPVPLHKKRLNMRGFNQSELIARYISKRLDLPGADALIRTKNTESQIKLKRKNRQDNVSGVFCCVDGEFIAGKDILLIDDVTTTGATLNDCARALKEAGAKKVWGAVVARNI